MSNLSGPEKKPKLLPIILLKCPYCSKTRLQKEKSWFAFALGCPNCHYAFEREEGYFVGAAWMVTYTVSALAAFACGAIMLWLFPNMDALVIAALSSLVAIGTALLLMPWCKALWLYVDHLAHPLHQEDHELFDRLTSPL